MPLVDTSPHRQSACPVHFLWDGRGLGRPFVRVGFLGFALAGMAATLGSMVRSDAATSGAVVVVAVAGGTWIVGQLLSALAARRPA